MLNGMEKMLTGCRQMPVILFKMEGPWEIATGYISDYPDWDEYKVRLGNHADRFEALGINYYPSKMVPWNREEER
jgi:hypothetical protein